ncbi:hypothetical protein RIF29_14089 [Crotalaria pallida]|uniref:RRM domain-containing protein n=1 Tax=Crotalaria pallida TaxID=3830 RepID=A0AAN9FGV6_CROPI
MAARMDMSLDDIIKRSSASRRRSRDRPRGPGPDRRFPLRNPAESTPYFIPQGRVLLSRQMLQPNMMMDGNAVAVAETETETETVLYISNLHHDVSNYDIKLLFSEEGELKRHCIHYDKSGRSKGTAEVVFRRQSDALAAIKKYNNMKLDGQTLRIELVGTCSVTPAVMPPFQSSSILGPVPNDVHVRGGGVSVFDDNRFYYGFAGGLLPMGHAEEKGFARKVSARDLDDDLERYRRLPRGRGQVKGHIGKVSAKELDDDLERYRRRLPRGSGQVKGHIGNLSARDLDDDLENFPLSSYLVSFFELGAESGKSLSPFSTFHPFLSS